MPRECATYAAFWPHYLREHAHPGTRRLHIVGIAVTLVLVALGVATLELWLLVAALVAGYAFAWLGHFLVEGNRPTAFNHPCWSLASDFRMFFLWCAGRLEGELVKAGVTS